jgi:predicted PurR-regulated permease PerM
MEDDKRGGSGEYWGQTTKDRWFFGSLALCAVLVALLFSGFLTSLLFAAVVVVVSWPMHQATIRAVHGRRGLATFLSTVGLFLGILGPIGLVLTLFVKEAVTLAGKAAAWFENGDAEHFADRIAAMDASELPRWAAWLLPRGQRLGELLEEPLRNTAASAVSTVQGALPGLISGTFNATIDVAMFLLAVVTLFMEGPKVLRVAKNLIPLDDAYEERLFQVFQRIAKNMVLGSLATALAQGTLAGIGFAIAGVERALFFAVLTAVCSIVPVFGAALVWVPLTIVYFAQHGLGWGLFLLGWNAVLTSQIDTIIRPLFMRGGTNVHPLLMFLAVFGGLGWLGLPGAVVGPVIVAFFLALYSIYVHDYLGRVEQPVVPQPPWFVRYPRRVDVPWFRRRHVGP